MKATLPLNTVCEEVPLCHKMGSTKPLYRRVYIILFGSLLGPKPQKKLYVFTNVGPISKGFSEVCIFFFKSKAP